MYIKTKVMVRKYLIFSKCFFHFGRQIRKFENHLQFFVSHNNLRKNFPCLKGP